MKRLIWNKHTKLALKHALGWFCLAAGTVMLITPGQGVLTILIGIYLLADEIPFFRKIKIRLQRRFPKVANYIHRTGKRLRARFHHEN